MKERVLACLEKNFPGIDFKSSDTLVDDGILDSLSIMEIIYQLSEEFGIQNLLQLEELSEENFQSVDAIAAMIERLQA